jgi:hypothetical protein
VLAPKTQKRTLRARSFYRSRDGLGRCQKRRTSQTAEAQFDIFLTIDSNLEFQQNIVKFNIAIIALVAKSNDIGTLRPLIPEVIKIIPEVEKGKVLYVEMNNLEENSTEKNNPE